MTARTSVASVGVVALVASLMFSFTAPASAAPVSVTFQFTGGAQTFQVPAGVTELTVETYGAQGGSSAGASLSAGSIAGVPGRLGGRTTAVLTVTPGEVLQVNVGGRGANGLASTGGGQISVSGAGGGFNGGGCGGYAVAVSYALGAVSDRGSCGGSSQSLNNAVAAAASTAGGGGGASDIRRGGTDPVHRTVVAGGGGGGGAPGVDDENGLTIVIPGGTGGHGGGATGQHGGGTSAGSTGGFGASGASGGAGGFDGGASGDHAAGGGGGGDGASDVSATINVSAVASASGGGGSGRAGGGGGGVLDQCEHCGGGGGGGGSGLGPAGATLQSGVRSGHGLVRITYEAPPQPGPACGEAPPSGFADVPLNVYYTHPVDWARAVGVTTGVGGTNFFEPLREVTRAEALTMVWRAEGSPQVAAPHGFVDVVTGSFYEAAVRWAKATGVTTGVGGSNRFAPDDLADRAQQVTFLWRVVTAPAVAAPHGFVDVVAGAYYEPAVRWAKAAGVTTGIGGGNTFAPHLDVDRAQQVTFLCRHYG